MKKKQKSESMIVPSIELWLDDIESIISIIKEQTSDVKISDRDYQYESIQELVEKKGTHPKTLEISSYSPHISLKFDRGEILTSTWLYSSAESPEAEGIFFRIRKLLLDRKRFINHIFNKWVAALLFIGIIAIPSDTIKSWFPLGIRLFLIVSMLFYIGITVLLLSGFFYSINLTERHTHKTFIARNGERILFIILGAIIVVVIEWLAGLFLP